MCIGLAGEGFSAVARWLTFVGPSSLRCFEVACVSRRILLSEKTQKSYVQLLRLP